MLGTSIDDGGAESDQFMSLPGTPASGDDDFFLMGELFYDHLVF
jgi:hypothetical protein